MSSRLERRIRALEDRLAIMELIARYGPAVDRGDADAVARIWQPDGRYRIGDRELAGEEVPRLVEWPTHLDYLAAGAGHLLTTPTIELGDDVATAWNHSLVLVRRAEVWVADRVSANRWSLERAADGWRVRERVNRLLDGAEQARAILQR